MSIVIICNYSDALMDNVFSHACMPICSVVLCLCEGILMQSIKLYRIWVGHDFWPSLSTLIFESIAVEIAIDYNSIVMDLLNMKSLYGMCIIMSPMHTCLEIIFVA